MVQSVSDDNEIRLKVVFYRSERVNEAMREWLKSLAPDEQRIIGEGS